MPRPSGNVSLGQITSRAEAVKGARSLRLAAPGLAQLRRDFRRLAPETDKRLRGELYQAVIPVRARARELAPARTGALRASLRISVQRHGVALYSRLPYSALIHWGGTTGRGHRPGVGWSGSVFVEPHLFISRALDENEGRVFDAMGNAVTNAARRTGWA